MNNLIKINIGFSRSPKWWALFSLIQRLWFGIKFSHTFLHWKSSLGPQVVYEAADGEVNLIEKSLFEKKAKVVAVYSLYITRDQYKDLIRFCLSTSGTKYGFTQIMGIAVKELFHFKGKNPFSDGKKTQVCSEVLYYFFTEILKEDLPYDPDTVTPKEIYDYVETHPRTKKNL